jgi:hypothetical protein
VYASQNLLTPGFRYLFLQALLAGVLFAFFVPNSGAASPEDAAGALARKICAPPMQKNLRVQWSATAGFTGDAFVAFQKVFLERLAGCGIEVTENSGTPVLNISAQPTASKIVFVAELAGSTEGRRIRIVEIPRSDVSISGESPSSLRLRKELLWQQQNPVKGAAEWVDATAHEHFLFLLSEGFLVRRRLENQVWVIVDSTELPVSARPNRLGTGTLLYDDQTPASLAVLVDGKICTIQVGSRVSFNCRTATPGERAVTMVSACDGKLQTLASGAGDYTQPDRISLEDQEDIRVGRSDETIRLSSVDMPGPVLDYVTAGEGKSVTAVVRNLSTGIYEVYRISTVCGR